MDDAVVGRIHTSVSVPPLFVLEQNHPNPFNPSTTIRFRVGGDGAVVLAIYDVTGRHVQTLVSQWLSAGQHTKTWDGRDADGRDVSSGVYFYRLQAGKDVLTKKMTLVR
jgi:flagellar hook assembly protein FlgD